MKKRYVESVYVCFGLKVRELRIKQGMSQEELASKVELSRASVVNIEAGRQRVLLFDVVLFAIALGTLPDKLMKGVWC